MESLVSGHQFTAIRERLADKLEIVRFDPYSKFLLLSIEDVFKSSLFFSYLSSLQLTILLFNLAYIIFAVMENVEVYTINNVYHSTVTCLDRCTV